MRKRALLAVAFAGGLLNCQLPALAEPGGEPADAVIQKFANSTQGTPEVRAFWMLKLAAAYLGASSKSEVDARYGRIAGDLGRYRSYMAVRSNRLDMFCWAEEVSSGRFYADEGTGRTVEAKPDMKTFAKEKSDLAHEAIRTALGQLEKTSDPVVRLNLYYIASRLLDRLGDAAGSKKCDRVIEEALRLCEGDKPANEKQIAAAVSVLDVMAYGIVSVHIPDFKPQRSLPGQEQGEVFSDKSFKDSERLKLRAIAMADRLSVDSHVRRKAHRDLALWYARLGKTQSAEKEKQILFKLVGSDSDNILYPQSGGCGHVVWWQAKPMEKVIACGMG
ncbi:MAG: hypothetical protein KC777_24785 [Cyanobacteria bacterium HKST-UBA02]|nr:hypothetical protein [Cyanobacteria bacterium HKST-UBA02]